MTFKSYLINEYQHFPLPGVTKQCGYFVCDVGIMCVLCVGIMWVLCVVNNVANNVANNVGIMCGILFLLRTLYF